MRILYTLILLIGFGFSLNAQQLRGKRSAPITVHLVDGSIFRGEILEYEIGKKMRLKISDKVTLEIGGNMIEKVVQASETKITKPDFVPQFKGWYNSTNIYTLEGFLAGIRESGLGIQNATGFQWKHWLGTGIGFGYDNFDLDSRLSSIPLFFEIRGQLTKDQVSPFYVLQGGYALGLKDEDRDIVKSEGGLMIHPSIGILFNSRNGKNAYTIDIGYRFQRYKYRQLLPWQDGFDDYKILHKRVAVRIGMIF